MAGPSRAPTSGENRKREWDDGSSRSHDRRFLCLLPLITVAFFFQDLEAADFLRSDVAPGDAEVRRVELQFQQPFKKAAGVRVRPSVIQVVKLAVRAAVDDELPTGTLRARAWRVGVLHCAHQPAFPAGDVVGIGAAAWTVRAAIAEFARAHRPEDQQPERDRCRPLIRR